MNKISSQASKIRFFRNESIILLLLLVSTAGVKTIIINHDIIIPTIAREEQDPGSRDTYRILIMMKLMMLG